MHHNKQFVKQTKKGKVLKVVREHYLRDDIWSGSPLAQGVPPEKAAEAAKAHKLSAEADHYLLIDTNVALHQVDLLEHSAIKDVIVCSTALQEVQHRNSSAYQRLRALCANADKRFFVFANEYNRETYVTAEPGESVNDRNDRALRVAAKWYHDRIPGVRTIYLTNDRDSRRKAQESGLHAMSAAEYARSRSADAPDLLDLVAAAAGAEEEEEKEDGPSTSQPGGDRPGGRPSKRKRVYAEHLPYSAIMLGIKEGKLHQGKLRVSRFNPFEGWVGSDSVGQDILISGRGDMNRAMDGDVVAVELLPEAQWKGPSAALPTKVSVAGDASATAASDDEAEEAELSNAVAAEVCQVAPGEHYEEVVGAGPGRQPTARIVGIIKRSWRDRGYCGSLQPPKVAGRAGLSHSVLVALVERKFPLIRIQTRQMDTLMDKRIVVAIDGWEADSMYPHGHYVRTIGTIGDKEAETEVILIENDINTSPFTPAVHDCVPLLPWRIEPQEYSNPRRLDLRHLCVCSVDPPGCRDIDDALHVRVLPNGNYEVGVHIADVTHFVRPDTPIDAEACSRATTVYLVQRRIDMLPKPLTEDICSLRGGEERLTFSVLWEMTPQADIVDTTFTKAIIKSRAALTYREAQARIDDPAATDELSVGLRTLNKIARILRARRFEAGALQLASPEVKFTIDTETHDPTDVGVYQTVEANSMVEEMMLLANISVAEKIVRHFASCSLLRRHPTPPPRQFEPLLKAAASAGFTLDVSSSKALAASLDTAVRANDPYFNKLVRIICTRCMTQAVYFGSGDLQPTEYHHYGLASAIYTHFTSPIRRYADVVVHRLLAAALGLDPLPDSTRDREGLHACSDNLNVRHRAAQQAGRASVELHTLIFFKDRTVVADARVTKVKANGLIVFVPRYGIEGPVYLTGKEAKGGKKAEELFRLDEEAQTVTSVDGSIKYSVFDCCAVRISVVETFGHRRQLVLQLEDRQLLEDKERVE